LNLKTLRATDGLAEYKGTSYVNMLAEMDRVKGLCERWGVAWRERGSLAGEDVSADEAWMKRPVVQTVSFNETPDRGFKKTRKQWYSQGNLQKSEGE